MDKKSYEEELEDFNHVYKTLRANCPNAELAYFIAGLHKRILDMEDEIKKLKESRK